MAGIPLSWLVEVTSSGVKDTFSLSKLPSLLITKYNAARPQETWQKFYQASKVGEAFGSTSNEKTFADNYFSFISKKST